MKKEHSGVPECEHHPYPSVSKWKAFFTFLICKRKYYFRYDSSAICNKCHAHIRTPKLYRSPVLWVIYGVFSALVAYGSYLSLSVSSITAGLTIILVFAAWLLFDRVFVAALFAFAKWPTDKDMGNCSGKDAYWGNNRIMLSFMCANVALRLIIIFL